MQYGFLIFAAILVWLSFKSFRGGIAYLRFFNSELAKPVSDSTPFVSVIAPCRGLDEELDKNLAALFHQEYPEYEILFVVDSSGDEAVPVIQDAISRFGSSIQMARLIVGRPPTGDSAKKVEKLREAVLHVSDRSRVFAFVDSDIRPSANWLRDLVAPLTGENVGAATGYRWFIATRPSFATELKSVWNASIASALGPNRRSNFTWGGSTAIRRAVFEQLDVRERWAGTLADDFALTTILRNADLEVVFVPSALTASIDTSTLAETVEFTTRQMKITRVYMPLLWLMSFIGSGLFNLVMIWSLAIVIMRPGVLMTAVAVATIVLVVAFSVGKSWLRLTAVRRVLGSYSAELNRQFWSQNTLWILTPSLFFINCVAALFSRRITWRGTSYELKSPTETVIIRG